MGPLCAFEILVDGQVCIIAFLTFCLIYGDAVNRNIIRSDPQFICVRWEG